MEIGDLTGRRGLDPASSAAGGMGYRYQWGDFTSSMLSSPSWRSASWYAAHCSRTPSLLSSVWMEMELRPRGAKARPPLGTLSDSCRTDCRAEGRLISWVHHAGLLFAHRGWRLWVLYSLFISSLWLFMSYIFCFCFCFKTQVSLNFGCNEWYWSMTHPVYLGFIESASSMAFLWVLMEVTVMKEPKCFIGMHRSQSTHSVMLRLNHPTLILCFTSSSFFFFFSSLLIIELRYQNENLFVVSLELQFSQLFHLFTHLNWSCNLYNLS